MKNPFLKRDSDGASYEPMEGQRESGDGDGDKKFIIDAGVLSPEELEQLERDADSQSGLSSCN